MKTKQVKEEQDKTDEETIIEPKTRARKKASDIINDEKNKPSQDEPKTSKDTKRIQPKPRTIAKKRPLGIRKALRSKKAAAVKEKVIKNVLKSRRGRKPRVKTEPDSSQDKETAPLIPAAEIKKEPIEDTSPNSRSSSPKTAGRRVRVSSDMAMMKTLLSDTPSTLVLGSRTSPYSMRSERSNSPSLFEAKNLRTGKPRKVKNLLSEVVIKEQKRRRLLSDSKNPEGSGPEQDCKKLKRRRSCSRDGSEVSKCSDNTESDLSMSETLDSDGKEPNKKVDKSKTDLDVDIENSIQIPTIEKVPSLNTDSKLAEPTLDPETSVVNVTKKKLSLQKSSSLDSDNNNSNRLKLVALNTSDVEDKLLLKTENDTLFEARSNILTSMSRTFNSKEMSKNIRRARRGRKAAAEARRPVPPPAPAPKPAVTSTITEPLDEKHETIETLSKDIDDLIKNLDQNIDGDHAMTLVAEANTSVIESLHSLSEAEPVAKLYGLNKVDDNTIVAPETPVKDKEAITSVANEHTPSKLDDSENIRLQYEDSVEKSDSPRGEITYKCSTVASIDKLMDRLKEFEEFDKRRQRQESESKSSDSKPVMVTNDVVLIHKSGAEFKPLDMQSMRSPERTIEKENVLSCFENNSAISIVKRDQVRRSVDIDLPNSVTLIKRNSVSARKESTSSNHSRESDAISIFEKSLGKDVTLTEIWKSVDKSGTSAQMDLHQFAALHPGNSSQTVAGHMLDSSQISITPRLSEAKIAGSDVQIITKWKSREESMSRKSSESTNDIEDKMATIEKIKSPIHQTSAVSITPAAIAIKSPESVPIEAEALPPPIETIKPVLGETPVKPDVNETPVKPILDETPFKPVLAETPFKPVLDETPVKPVLDETPGKPFVDETPIKPVLDESPVKPVLNETPVKPDVSETPLKHVLAEIPFNPVVNETPVKPVVNETPLKPVVNETPFKSALDETSVKSFLDVTLVKLDLDKTPVASSDVAIENKPETKPEVPVQEITKVDEVLSKMEVDNTEVEKVVLPEKMDVEESRVVEEIAKEKPETPVKPIVEDKENKKQTEDLKPGKKSLRNSIESQPGPSNAFNETAESQKRKENVLRTLGLLTHKAAKEAKIEKAKEKERINTERLSNKGKAAKSSGDYTGTLKTVIKLNRGGEKKKHRSSLKMTFQKTKYRSGKPAPEMGEVAAEDSTFYTIERRDIAAATSADDAEPVPEPTEPKETLNLVIPEKASSFSIHPGRLCMDQCFYCGGKFGLFDTPCHIAQIKSSERQKKVLANEEKLTIDSCLCDACYRHVDRRANCPSYRKRPLPKHSDIPALSSPPALSTEKPSSPPLEDESESDSAGAAASGRVATCHTEACVSAADYSIRRKWLIKMRSSVNKVLKLKGDYPGLHTIPLCSAHYRALSPLMACLLCRRRLTKHHNLHFIHHGYTDLNPLLTAASLPVQFSERPVLCKGCRYYCSLLQRPGHNDGYASGYRRKLLQVYNIEVPPDPEGAFDISLHDPSKPKKKQRNKSRQRKSTEPDNSSENSSEKTNESTPEKDQPEKPLEEDIESLISSNRILVPGAGKTNDAHPSDGSDENSEELPALLTKQTELQYLLQKQNNPAQFLQGQPNPAHKQKTILKLSVPPAIIKPAQQHRITEKNTKKIHKIGQLMLNKDKVIRKDEMEIFADKSNDDVLKNITLNDECTIESIPTKRTPDINTLKNKWQMTESFTQVKKNLSELSKKLPVEREPKKSEVKYSNPVKRLETNPSISVRELFPGEEEMNLQCNIEFNNVKGVTPEGWEKSNTTIQYDTETRRLWNELQRPYGNQSSFLRHLVLLEKYFRSGDLVLSHTASPPAANYSDSVQSRLRAYDNIVNDTPRRAEPAISLIEYRKKPSINGKSLLKSNHTDDKDTKRFMPPPSGAPKLKSKEKHKKQLPPELIAINTPNAQGRKSIQNVLHNIQQLVKGVSASDPTEIAASPVPAVPSPAVLTAAPSPAVSMPLALPMPGALPMPPALPKPDPPKEKKEKSDTPKKSKNSSKPWRPTLMPITPENLSKIAREPTQLAVDGRSLPSLVQVMSSGKRYHITLQDYNKMCIMRREKLQQLQDVEKKRPSIDDSTVITELQPSTMLGNGGTVTQITTEDKKEDYSGNAATILKNVGLKNITIAPIPAKSSTITSPTVSSPLIITSTPIKIPQLGSSVSITSETVLTPNLPIMTSTMIMPKMPKSLTVIPQTIMASMPQSIVMTTPQVFQSEGPRP